MVYIYYNMYYIVLILLLYYSINTFFLRVTVLCFSRRFWFSSPPAISFLQKTVNDAKKQKIKRICRGIISIESSYSCNYKDQNDIQYLCITIYTAQIV